MCKYLISISMFLSHRMSDKDRVKGERASGKNVHL